MKTRTLVDQSIEIVRVTSLKPGDVYKRLEISQYNGDKMVFGVVEDVVTNGEQVAITTIEAELKYGSAVPVMKVFKADSDLHLFPASVKEVELHFIEVRKAAAEVVRTKTQELANAVQLQDMLTRMESRALTAAPTAAGIEQAEV